MYILDHFCLYEVNFVYLRSILFRKVHKQIALVCNATEASSNSKFYKTGQTIYVFKVPVPKRDRIFIGSTITSF